METRNALDHAPDAILLSTIKAQCDRCVSTGVKPLQQNSPPCREQRVSDHLHPLLRPPTEDEHGVINAKLADFGLHAIVDAAERSETIRKMCAAAPFRKPLFPASLSALPPVCSTCRAASHSICMRQWRFLAFMKLPRFEPCTPRLTLNQREPLVEL